MSWILNIFGKKKTLQEQIREYIRQIKRASRDLDREQEKIKQQEKKLIMDIKKMAKQNQMSSVKIMAKDLVRTRKYMSKFYNLKAQMQSVSLRLLSVKSIDSLNEAMKNVGKAMGSLNKRLNLPSMNKIMAEFEKQSETMDLKEDMMSDAIDEAMDSDEDEEETEQLVSQVMDEIGLDMQSMIGATPQNQIASSSSTTAEQKDPEEDKLFERFANLRNG